MKSFGARLAGLALAGLALAGCRRELAVEVIPRGHSEVVLEAAGSAARAPLAPLFLGLENKAGLCFEIAAGQDVSRWQGRLHFGESASEWQDPAFRSGQLLCFGALLPRDWAGVPGRRAFELGAEIRDELAGKNLYTPRLRAYFEPDQATARALEADKQSLLASAYQRPVAALVGDLDRLADSAEQRLLPLAAVQIRLIAVHFLMRQGGSGPLEEAAARLDQLPRWLESPVAGYFGAVAEYQAGLFAGENGSDQVAWERIARADSRLRQMGLPRLSTAVDLAKRLARVGDLSEARARVESALAECAGASRCNADLLALAKADLAWLILQDGAADPAELDRAETLLGEVLATPGIDGLNRANAFLSLAYRHLLAGRDAAPALAAAAALLEGGESSARRSYYRQWQELLGGLGALARHHHELARRTCLDLATRGLPEIKAWAWDCVGRVERARRQPGAALAAFEQALAAHELLATRARREEVLPLGLDQRADAFLEAARAAIEKGEPATAWRILARLDQLSVAEVDRRRCREAASGPALRRQWQELEAEIDRLLALLPSLEAPAPGRERESRASSAREVKARLRDLWRQWPGCRRESAEPAEPAELADDGLDYRAFALDDEILLLGRGDGDGDGDRRSVELLRRAAWPRRELAALLLALERAPPGRQNDDDWQRQMAPLAAALVPPEAFAGHGHPRRTFGLHGILQALPLAALPLPGENGWEPLGSRWAVVVAPAGGSRRRRGEPARRAGRNEALFVLDPSGNLGGALTFDAALRSLYPRARVLRGAAATRQALVTALPQASLLHLDSHATYDTAFPELSALELADAPLRWLELAGLDFELELANLSGCQTGLWPITADSGSYGLGGALVRLGVPTVIASRRPLPDAVAADFNRSFYAARAGGSSYSEAWRQALAALQGRHPASAWSGLMLLGGGRSPEAVAGE